MPGPLHVHHDHQLDEMAHMEAVRRGVEADVEGDGAFPQQLPDLFFMRHLLDEAPLHQNVVNVCAHRVLH